MMRYLARRSVLFAATGTVLLVAGVITLVVAGRAQRHAPQPPPAAASPITVVPSPGTTTHAHGPTAARPSGSASRPTPAIRGPILSASLPVHLDVPAIGADSVIHPLGLNPDGTVQVPPLSKDSYPGWYKYSPTPGQLGPSIILGHIDSAKYGPGIFFRLGALRQRDTISITRADHTVAVFEVERVVEYPKAHFPTLQVYGNTDRADLRLITCGGKFDFAARSYEDNIVVYASLVSSHPA